MSIGGGGFGRNSSDYLIEKYLLSLSNKPLPKICFLPTATGDNDSYIVQFYSTFLKFNCIPSHIDCFKRTLDFNSHIISQDIIFVGGGNTKSMLGVWKEWGIDKVLLDAYLDGVIMSGVSAGAICWFNNGITDSWNDELKVLPCLGFIDGTCCPHYDEEVSRKPYVEKLICQHKLDNCISIEGGSALHIVNGEPIKSISFKQNKNTYQVYLSNSSIIHKPYPLIQL